MSLVLCLFALILLSEVSEGFIAHQSCSQCMNGSPFGAFVRHSGRILLRQRSSGGSGVLELAATAVDGDKAVLSSEGPLSSHAGNKVNKVQTTLMGKFSNLAQASKDARNGKPTAKEGGHEYVTAEITQHPDFDNIVVASYYYGEDPSKVFRYRLYEFVVPNEDEDEYEDEDEKKNNRGAASASASKGQLMKLYRPKADFETRLKESNYDVSKISLDAESILNSANYKNHLFEYLEGCDVVWTGYYRKRDMLKRLQKKIGAIRKRIDASVESFSAFDGVLKEGECSICSQNDPNLKLTIKDNLKLTPRSLWINDRVYTSDGVQIIGNPDGVPYKMERIV